VTRGKTKRDKKSGAYGNRFLNRAKRVAWQHELAANGHRKAVKFPIETCGGKRYHK